MLSLKDEMLFMLNGGNTKRYHTQQLINPQTVGQHSYGVACFLWLLCRGQCRAGLLMAAISHDAAEQVVGDVPSPTKRAVPALKSGLDEYEEVILSKRAPMMKVLLSPKEKRALKLADIYDGMWYCWKERAMGNTLIEEVYNNFQSYGELLAPEPGQEGDIFNLLKQLWREANGTREANPSRGEDGEQNGGAAGNSPAGDVHSDYTP